MSLLKRLFGVGKVKHKLKVVPVIEDPTKRKGREYRRTKDDVNVIRVNQRPAKGLAKKFINYTSVAGLRYRYDDALAFIHGSNREIILQREPNNPFDKNAIAVYGAWSDASGRQTRQLGYLRREEAEKMTSLQLFGATLDAMYQPYKDKSIGIRVSVWIPASRIPKTVKSAVAKSNPPT